MTTHDLVVPTDSVTDVAGTGSSPEPHGTGPVATPEPDGSPSATETDAGGAARLPAAPASTQTDDGAAAPGRAPGNASAFGPAPVATPTAAPSSHPLDVDEFDRINAALWDHAYADLGRVEELLTIAVGALGSIATNPGRYCDVHAFPVIGCNYCTCDVRRALDTRAAQALRRMLQRVLLGSTHEETEDHR